MKKVLVILLALLLLCACGNKHEEEVVTKEPAPNYRTAYMNESEYLEYLSGEWEQCPNGNLNTNDKVTTLVIDKDNKEATLNINDGNYIKANIELKDLFLDNKQHLNLIEFKPYEASQSLIDENGDNYDVYNSSLQFYVVNYLGKQFLLLRETGNGLSVSDKFGFGNNYMIDDYGWLFTREDKSGFPSKKQNDDNLEHDYAFVALKWFDDGKHVALQPMDVEERIENWDGANELHVQRVFNTRNQYSLTAFIYKYKGVKDNEYKLPDVSSPKLVKVITDENGDILTIEELPYVGYGVYAMSLDFATPIE